MCGAPNRCLPSRVLGAQSSMRMRECTHSRAGEGEDRKGEVTPLCAQRQRGAADHPCGRTGRSAGPRSRTKRQSVTSKLGAASVSLSRGAGADAPRAHTPPRREEAALGLCTARRRPAKRMAQILREKKARAQDPGEKADPRFREQQEQAPRRETGESE